MTGLLIRAPFAALLIAVTLAAQTSPASFDERHKLDSAANPPDLRFVLRTTISQTQFHSGERIPITLEFSSGATDKYRLDAATYDRSGRLPNEEFVMERHDVVDPLTDFFNSGVMGWLGGGLRGTPVLNAEPHRINLMLNDWFRFDKPGRYRLYLKSHRISRERLPSEPGDGLVHFAPASNILEIEITRHDPAWEAAKLAELQETLDPSGRPPVKLADPFFFHTQEHGPKVRQAAEELRYLGTPGAVRLMMELTRRDLNDLDQFGLIGSPHRSLVVDEFDRYLQDPDTLIVAAVISLRALFDYVAKFSPAPLPLYKWQLQETDWTRTRTEAESRHKQFETVVRLRAMALIPAVTHKSASVRTQCADAIAQLAPEEARSAGLVPPTDYGMSRAELIANFGDFSEKQQLALLTNKWGLVRGPEMLPALRQLVAGAQPIEAEKPHEYDLRRYRGILTETALERMKEYAPEEVRKILWLDLARSQPSFAQFALRELPTQEVPEADPIFSERLTTNLTSTLPFVAKFGSVTLADQIREVFGAKDSWPCAEEESFLAYFARVLPSDGPGGSRDLLARAMAARGHRGCFHWLLGRVARVVWNPVVEEQAILALNDPDPEAAVDAARVLSRYGSASAEALLWKRLEQWSAKWRGRVKQFAGNRITGMNPNREEGKLGDGLFDAIAEARAWYLDEVRMGRLRALCIDDSCRERWSPSPADVVHVEASKYAAQWERGFKVQQYTLASMQELKAKLAQFPANTAFRWCPRLHEPFETLLPEEAEDLYADLESFLAGRQMHIERYAREACSPGKAP